jgi:hypothetical protein
MYGHTVKCGIKHYMVMLTIVSRSWLFPLKPKLLASLTICSTPSFDPSSNKKNLPHWLFMLNFTFAQIQSRNFRSWNSDSKTWRLRLGYEERAHRILQLAFATKCHLLYIYRYYMCVSKVI